MVHRFFDSLGVGVAASLRPRMPGRCAHVSLHPRWVSGPADLGFLVADFRFVLALLVRGLIAQMRLASALVGDDGCPAAGEGSEVCLGTSSVFRNRHDVAQLLKCMPD